MDGSKDLGRDDIVYRERLMNTHRVTFEETQTPGYQLLPRLTQELVDEFKQTVARLTRPDVETKTYGQLQTELIPKTRECDPTDTDRCADAYPDMSGIFDHRIGELFSEASDYAQRFVGPDDDAYDAQAAAILELPGIAVVKVWNHVAGTHDMGRIKALHTRTCHVLMEQLT